MEVPVLLLSRNPPSWIFFLKGKHSDSIREMMSFGKTESKITLEFSVSLGRGSGHGVMD